MHETQGLAASDQDKFYITDCLYIEKYYTLQFADLLNPNATVSSA
jgi:hypothetical protein